MTLSHLVGYLTYMGRRSQIRSTTIVCLTAASILAGGWQTPAGACPCTSQLPQPILPTCCCQPESIGEPCSSPCCQKKLADHSTARLRCEAAGSEPFDSSRGCQCSQSIPTPEPAVPPPSSRIVDHVAFVAMLAAMPALGDAKPRAAWNLLVTRNSSPPTDLVISLSRITC